MKSSHFLLVPILLATGAQADVLSSLSPFLGSSRPDFDPASIQADSAMDDPVRPPFSPADSDFGVQQILGSYKGRAPVNVNFDTSVGFTDNAPGTVFSDQDPSWFSANRLAVTWLPRIAGGWFADIGIAQDLFRFEGSDSADFENFQPHIGVVKSIPELADLVFYARYEYQRLTDGSFSESTYDAQTIRVGLQKDLILAPRYQLSAGVDAAFDISANEDRLEHNEYAAGVSYTYWLADRLCTTLSWTGTMSDFDTRGREDWSHIVGLELAWTPCRDARVFANVFYTNCDSNTAGGANDFEAWQSGVGLGLNLSF